MLKQACEKVGVGEKWAKTNWGGEESKFESEKNKGKIVALQEGFHLLH